MSDPKLMDIDPVAKLKIIGLEESCKDVTVSAQFNPKELQLDKAVPWQKQKKSKDAADLEFTGAEPMSMALELMFDGFEGGTSVIEEVRKVHQLADLDTKLKRPSKVKVIWGTGPNTKDFPGVNIQTFPEFTGVIESVSTKYTMFAGDGSVLRATVNIKLKQANNLGVGKKS